MQLTPDTSRALYSDEDDKAREESTKDILKKIEQVNLAHGFTPRNLPGRRPNEDKSKQMTYHPQMFGNPVWNYLQREQNSGIKNKVEEDKVEKEEIPKGHYIKRKITHKQTYLVPNVPDFVPPEPQLFGIDSILDPVEMTKSEANQSEENLAKQQFLINNIKSIVQSSQTPFSNTYNPYFPPYQNFAPYQQPQFYQRTPTYNPNNLQGPFTDTYYANLQAQRPYDVPNFHHYDDSKVYGTQDISSQTIKFPNKPHHFRPPNRFPGSRQDNPRPIITAENQDTQYVRLPDIPRPERPKQLGPVQGLPDAHITRQFIPSNDYFPMNPPPFKGVYSSITSMVEYGQKDEDCNKEGKDANSIIAVRSGKGVTLDEFDLELLKFLEDVMKSVDDEIEKEISPSKPNSTDNGEPRLNQTEIKTESSARVGREIVSKNVEKGQKLMQLLELIRTDEVKNGPKGIVKYLERLINETNEQNLEDSALELEGIQIVEEDDTKSPKQMSSKFNLNKPKGADDKFMDRANGTGIFINRLKVRKGGIAIAGPGGIATAGSGGTAIVGPNGVAYTQPNGVAIAGPGSRVVAVDPSVDLNKFVQNLSKGEKSGVLPRIGRVVAIGPVVYYNRDDKV